MKKIVIVTGSIPPVFAGGGLRAYRYALRLYKENKLAFIITNKPDLNLREKFEFNEVNKKSKVPSNKILTVPQDCNNNKVRSRNKIKYFIPFTIWQIKLLYSIFWRMFQKRSSFKIVHCIGSGSWLSLYSVFIGKLLGKKTILEMTLLGQDDPISIQDNSSIRLIGIFRQWLFSKADIIISISPALSQAYKLSSVSIKKLREVANPVDIKKFYPISTEKRLKLRKKYGFRAYQKIILFVGIIEERKSIDLLIKSCIKVFKKHSDALLLLVGPVNSSKENMEFSEKMKKLTQRLNIEKHVVFTGLKDNVDEYMKISDIFVFLSKREGLPNVILESMSTGLPVIALNIPGITEYIIQDRIDGIIVKNEDLDKIAIAITLLLEDRSLCKYISRNARKTVENRFSTEIIDQQYQRIYEEIT